MPTLIISDLHLGNRAQRDVLRRRAPRERLLAALDGVQRLVLLGDVAELVTRDPRRSLAVAEPVLRAVGGRLGAAKEVLLVPGNHDWPLVRDWAGRQGPNLQLDASVPPGASPNLARIVSWLAPAKVRVHYPGVWLDGSTYATHGHYLDDLLVPHSPIGLPLSSSRDEDPPEDAGPWLYEQRHMRRLARLSGRPSRHGPSRLAGQVVHGAVPRVLMQAGRTSVTAAAVDLQMRRAAAPALRTVLGRTGVQAERVVFGHVHRLGPMKGDRAAPWSADDGPHLLNTGSWLYERLLVGSVEAPHPYWPGGAILIEPGAAPRAVGLLDGLSHAELRAPRRRRSVP